MIEECVKLAPGFTVGRERLQIGEAIVWRASIAGHHHAGAVTLRPAQVVDDEEELLKNALIRIKAIVAALPEAEPAAPVEEDQTPT